MKSATNLSSLSFAIFLFGLFLSLLLGSLLYLFSLLNSSFVFFLGQFSSFVLLYFLYYFSLSGTQSVELAESFGHKFGLHISLNSRDRMSFMDSSGF